MGERMDWQAFWPFYLEEHADPRNQWLHFTGTTLAIVLAAVAAVTQVWWWLLGALVAGYGFAWVGHFGFEHNRPATFKYPVKSLASDFRLWFLTLTGRAGKAYREHGVR